MDLRLSVFSSQMDLILESLVVGPLLLILAGQSVP